MAYRVIGAKTVFVSLDSLQAVKQMLEASGWEAMEVKGTGEIYPQPVPYAAFESIQVLIDLEVYVLSKGQIIVEDEEDKESWVHVVYDGKGHSTQTTTTAGKWEV